VADLVKREIKPEDGSHATAVKIQRRRRRNDSPYCGLLFCLCRKIRVTRSFTAQALTILPLGVVVHPSINTNSYSSEGRFCVNLSQMLFYFSQELKTEPAAKISLLNSRVTYVKESRSMCANVIAKSISSAAFTRSILPRYCLSFRPHCSHYVTDLRRLIASAFYKNKLLQTGDGWVHVYDLVSGEASHHGRL